MRWMTFCLVACCAACGADDTGHRRTAFGLMLPLQGALGYASADIENGVSAAVAYINSIGGLLGEQITYTVVDSGIPQTGFATSTQAAQTLIDGQRVPALLGYAMDPALSDYLTTRNTPVVMPFDSTPLPQGANQIWPVTVNLTVLGKAMAVDMHKLGFARIGYFHGAPSYAPQTPPFAPYLQALNPNASYVDGAYAANADASNWDATDVVSSVLAQKPDAVLILSDSLPESYSLFHALRAADFPPQNVYVTSNQSISGVVRHTGKNSLAFNDRTASFVRQVLSGYQGVSYAASNAALQVYSDWAGAYVGALNSQIALDAVCWMALAITAANSWEPAAVQAHMFDVVQGPLPDANGQATATLIPANKLAQGFALLREGKPVWWQQSAWDAVQMTAPGADLSGDVEVATQAEDVVATYHPQDYNLPQFPN